uniref:Uncharacterized protein n=1 Tax=Sphaerodactylus townsendi TaxID=933632 RepID=A0ACB8FWD7_9SAUR
MEYIPFFVLLQRIAKKMLLEEIKANLSSEEDVSSDEESDDGKKKTAKPSENQGDNEENEQEDDSSSGSDVEEAKKSKYRHRLLRHKLTMSDGESEEEKKGKSKESKEVKRRNRRQVSSEDSIIAAKTTVESAEVRSAKAELEEKIRGVINRRRRRDGRSRSRMTPLSFYNNKQSNSEGMTIMKMTICKSPGKGRCSVYVGLLQESVKKTKKPTGSDAFCPL